MSRIRNSKHQFNQLRRILKRFRLLRRHQVSQLELPKPQSLLAWHWVILWLLLQQLLFKSLIRKSQLNSNHPLHSRQYLQKNQAAPLRHRKRRRWPKLRSLKSSKSSTRSLIYWQPNWALTSHWRKMLMLMGFQNSSQQLMLTLWFLSRQKWLTSRTSLRSNSTN